MTARDPNIEQDVRSMVQRIVDGLLDDSPDSATDGLEVGHESTDPSEWGRADTIAVGGDHGGYMLKERLVFKLAEAGHTVIDCGTDSTDAVDYPDIAVDVARRVAGGEADIGIVVDGAGIGSAMVANKIPGVRAALCYDLSTARNAREHNHANVLSLGAALIGDGLAWQITQEFIATPFGMGRHARRVAMIDAVDHSAVEVVT
ncbi:MAG: ribose 5-phosphate isomerase B [Acidimicrobiia bacterium]